MKNQTKYVFIEIVQSYECDDFTVGNSGSNYEKYCYDSRINSQKFCIGQTGTVSRIDCENIGSGIRLIFDVGKNHPMRFNEFGNTICQNYHLDYLKNLARSLGYINYRVDYKKSGDTCKSAWLDSNGNFQASTSSTSRRYPFDISFWGPITGR